MKSVLYLSMLIISVLSIDFANAQSTLTNGDIIFTGYNGVPPNGTPDTFTFVVVSPILPGTTIYFTERGYQGGATWQTAGTTEGTVSWMTSTLISVGDNVLIAGLGGSAAMVNGVPNGMVTQVLGGNPISGLSLSDAGDQVIAFQGGGGDPTIAVNFIAGISWMLNCGTTSVASWNASGCSYGPQTSLMPPGLIGGFSAYLAGVAGTNPNANKGKFNCFGTPYSNVSAMRSAIMSTSNWVYNFPPATGAVPLSVSCNNYASCTNPNIISSSGNTFACVNGNASFSINATGATGYQWQVNQGSGFNNIVNGAPYSGATSNMLGITGATASMNGYLYRCIASNGACTSTSTQAQLSVDNTQLSNITTNISCNGMANGSINLSVTGSYTPYTYLWSNGAITEDISGLVAGSYSVTVTNQLACTSTRTVSVTQPPAISLAAIVTNVACNGGNTGAIDLTPSGGAGGFTYAWSNGHTTQDLLARPAGTYTVTVTDANGCTSTLSRTITQPPAIVPGSIFSNVTCFGGNNGFIDLTVSGGLSPYSYAWSNGSPNQDQLALVAGTYTVTVTDANGCTTTHSRTISQPPATSITSVVTNVSCNGGTNGAINITVTGGIPGFTFAWTSGNSTEDITGKSAGSYTVTVTDSNGCTATHAATITQPPLINLSTSVTNVSCNGGNNGTIDLTPSGGLPSFTYLWSTGATTQDLSGNPAGNYTVTVTDANGCTASTTAVVGQPAAFNITINPTPVTCYGGSNGSADLTIMGGSTPYSYLWSNGQITEDINMLVAGTYGVTVTDANGCTGSQTVNIAEPPMSMTYTFIGPGNDINDPNNWLYGCLPPLSSPAITLIIDNGVVLIYNGVINGNLTNNGTLRGNLIVLGTLINNGNVSP